jgi:hypothetical protein
MIEAEQQKSGRRGNVSLFAFRACSLRKPRGFQVHGVFLGWRGRLVQGPLDYLTFLDRKGAATRVAGTPITEAIFEIIRQARKATRVARSAS